MSVDSAHIVDQRVRAVFGHPVTWLVIVGTLASMPIWSALHAPALKPLPVFGTLKEFALTDQQSAPFGTAQLQNKVWIANFIFTRCQTICPPMTAKMGQIQHRGRNLGTDFHLVSFTADPDYDTPDRLRLYAEKHRYSPRMWSFVTGSLVDIKEVVVNGLKVAMGNNAPDGNPEGIFHGSHFVLIDRQMRIRGYYDSNEPGTIDSLLHDAGLLVNNFDRGPSS